MVSDDASRVVFQTGADLLPEDSDPDCHSTQAAQPCADIYRLAGGVLTLVSTGPTAGNAAQDAVLNAISPDGDRIVFTTRESLVSEDADGGYSDVYQWSGGVPTLVSTGPNSPEGFGNATFAGASSDGARVFFMTTEPLVDTDADLCPGVGCTDLYERHAGTTVLVSTGPAGGNGNFHVRTGDVSADGSHAYFETVEQLTSDDTDGACHELCSDVYARAGGTTTLVSTGPSSPHAPLRAYFLRATPDGGRVLFETPEPLVAADTDSRNDLYERSAGTTSLISTGPAGGNADISAEFSGSSTDGTRVFFRTEESLVAADADICFSVGCHDVYERSAGATTLISTGPTGGDGSFRASFGGSSAAGDRVAFETSEPLVPADGDLEPDLYERAGGATTLVSTGSSGGTGPFPAGFEGMSADGSRTFFATDEALVPEDVDSERDVYERFAGATWQLADASATEFWGSSTDGARVILMTPSQLSDADTDPGWDLYAAGLASRAPFDRPARTSVIQVSLVPAFRQTISATQCQARGGSPSGHGPPLAFSSCNPPGFTPGTVAHIGARSSGQAQIAPVEGDPTTPADEADVVLSAQLTDVRSSSSTGSDYDPAPSGSDITLVARWRVSDLLNGPGRGEPGTAQDAQHRLGVSCTATPDPTVGSTCAVSTTSDGLTPGTIRERKAMVIQHFRLRLDDSGANGVPADADDRNFAQQGIYVP